MKYVKFTALPDTWYKEGTEAFIDNTLPIKRLTEDEWNSNIIESGEWDSRCFLGVHVAELGNGEVENCGCMVGEERIDSEVCSLDEFSIEFVDEPLEFLDREEMFAFFSSL